MYSISFTISSCIFVILLIIIYFLKVKYSTIENKFFSAIMITSLISTLVEVYSYFLVNYGISLDSFLYTMTIKVLFFTFLTWLYLFAVYILIVTLKLKEKMVNNKLIIGISIILFTIITSIVMLLPLNIIEQNGLYLPVGSSVNAIYIIAAICLLLMLCLLGINYKNLKNKKYYPLYFLIIILIVAVLLQKLFPELLLINFYLVIITYIMYFTIENPDIKMMKDLRYNKAMLERENEATLKGLNKLSNSLHEPLARLTELSKKKITKKDLQETLENTGEIQKISLNLVEQINNIIDISKLTSGKLEIKKIHYLTEESIKQLKELTDEYQVKYEITEKLPKLLYGDPEKIKQSILYLLNFIKKGFVKPKITLNLDSLTVGALCKIKFKIIVNYQDLANNIQIYKFNNKLSLKTTLIEYEIYERIIELLQGKTTYLIEDNKITFSFSLYNKLDDLTETPESPENIKYFDAADKRVLIIDNNRLNSKLLIDKLAKYNVKIEICSFEEDFLDLINSDKTYDLVLYNEEVVFEHYELNNEENIKNSLNRLRLVAGYRLPFVIMTNTKKPLNSSIEYLTSPHDEQKLNILVTKYLKND